MRPHSSLRRKQTERPSGANCGAASLAWPVVICRGSPPATGTSNRWKSTDERAAASRPVVATKTIDRPSGVQAGFKSSVDPSPVGAPYPGIPTSFVPASRSRGSPPSAGTTMSRDCVSSSHLSQRRTGKVS